MAAGAHECDDQVHVGGTSGRVVVRQHADGAREARAQQLRAVMQVHPHLAQK